VSFEEAVTVFADPLAVLVMDAAHAERALLVGESALGRVLVTVFVEVVETETRIISARRATKHERRRYEDGEEA
jgi:uncharacterized DUF497 family protein